MVPTLNNSYDSKPARDGQALRLVTLTVEGAGSFGFIRTSCLSAP